MSQFNHFVMPMRCLICLAEWEAPLTLPCPAKDVAKALDEPCPDCGNDDLSKIVIVDEGSEDAD